MEGFYLMIVLAPLLGAAVAGLFGQQVGRQGAHIVTIVGVSISFLLSVIVFWEHALRGAEVFNGTVYTWMISDGIRFEIGFLIDNLTALMMLVVTFVSLMVHIYTIGYMRDDPGYQRFFALISLFTFSMLMLVMANNFLQLFFGWEAVGLVSYLLIGFWFKRPTAIYANMKAFIVNRIGDFAFVLGIGAIFFHASSLDYVEVFEHAGSMSSATISLIPGMEWSLLTVACILLFIGAMAKSAQVPLHVWLPDSMEGPTPISALIHAATMVTAGIFMVARMSPLYEHSVVALSFILIIGAITAFFMGLVGLVQNDIKRVVAYSTLSQLGYMTVALGASAYAAGLFHLMTHAFFKALLFLAAGSVIIAMHHEQDIRRMGGLRKYMPITYFTALIGSLALIGFPGFSGFFSKDGIIEAVHYSSTPGAGMAYVLVLMGVFVTALYSFRMFFLVFHGEERFRHSLHEHEHHHGHHAGEHHAHGADPRESPWVVTVPLILLAIPSVLAGYFIGPLLFGDFFAGAVHVDESRDVLAKLGESYTGIRGFMVHAMVMPPFWLAMAGLFTAWYVYTQRPEFADQARNTWPRIHAALVRQYGFDEFNERYFAAGARRLGEWLWRFGDSYLIDDVLVNGTARAVGRAAMRLRQTQTGYLYHYAFAMILGLLGLVIYFVR